MTDLNHDLFDSFGKLMQNRAFMMAVMHQRDLGDMHGGMMGGGRGQMRLLQLLSQSPALFRSLTKHLLKPFKKSLTAGIKSFLS